jgi:hypothetical protein
LIVGVADEVVVPVLFVILLFVRVFVELIDGITTPSTAKTPADDLESVVSLALPSSIDPTHKAVLVEAVSHAIGRPVQLVSVPEAGVQRAGVVRVGLVSVLFVRVCVPHRVTTEVELVPAVEICTSPPLVIFIASVVPQFTTKCIPFAVVVPIARSLEVEVRYT